MTQHGRPTDNGPVVMTVAELLASIPPFRDRLAAELWKYAPENLTITGGPTGYEIDLERLTTSAQVCDVIFQVLDKAWASDELMASLVRTLDLLLEPQHYLCSFGKERGPIDPGKVIRRRLRRE